MPTDTIAGYLYDGQQIIEERNHAAPTVWTQVYFWGRYVDELLFLAMPTATVYRVISDLLYRSVAIVTTSNVVTEAYDTDAYGNTLCYSGPGTDGLWFTDDDVRTNNPINTTIFTGRQYDPESQIYYYRARYYSPQIGRFLSRDPLGSMLMMDFGRGASGPSVIDQSLLRLAYGNVDPTGSTFFRLRLLSREPMTSAALKQGPNLYWYVQDNPANATDASGLVTTANCTIDSHVSCDVCVFECICPPGTYYGVVGSVKYPEGDCDSPPTLYCYTNAEIYGTAALIIVGLGVITVLTGGGDLVVIGGGAALAL